MKTKDWAKGKADEVVLTALPLVYGAEGFYLLASSFKSEDLFDGSLKVPPVNTWLELYRSTRLILSKMMDQISSIEKFSSPVIRYHNAIERVLGSVRDDDERRPQKLSNELPQNVFESIKDEYLEEVSVSATEMVDGIVNLISGELNVGAAPDAFSLEPELIFGFLVLVPCWLFYREVPALILRKARQGNKEQIEKLLRLDPTAIFDKKIAENIHKLRFEATSFRYESIIKALSKPPKEKITRQRIKIVISGYIASFSERLGRRLTEPEIRGLFDAVCYDNSYGEQLIDTDLPESPEAFKRAIAREKRLWDLDSRGDKK